MTDPKSSTSVILYIVLQMLMISGQSPVNIRRHFAAITKLITGLTGHPRVIIVVMIYRGGFVLARMEVCDKF